LKHLLTKEEITEDHVMWYISTHRSFGHKWSTPGPSKDHARRCIEQGLRPSYQDGSLTFFSEEWEAQLDWAFRIIDYLTEEVIRIPKQTPSVSSWDEVIRALKTEVQKVYVNRVADMDEDETAWAEDIAQAVSWFIENASPFLIWTVYERVQEDLLDFVRENMALWVADGRPEDIAKKARDSFEQAMKGFEAQLNDPTRGYYRITAA